MNKTIINTTIGLLLSAQVSAQTDTICEMVSGKCNYKFDFNTNENITDVTASTTNDLVIKILPASTLTKIYGATVTIVAT